MYVNHVKYVRMVEGLGERSDKSAARRAPKFILYIPVWKVSDGVRILRVLFPDTVIFPIRVAILYLLYIHLYLFL